MACGDRCLRRSRCRQHCLDADHGLIAIRGDLEEVAARYQFGCRIRDQAGRGFGEGGLPIGLGKEFLCAAVPIRCVGECDRGALDRGERAIILWRHNENLERRSEIEEKVGDDGGFAE